MQNANISNTEITKITELIENDESIKELDFSRNRIGNRGVTALMNYIIKNDKSNIAKIFLSRNIFFRVEATKKIGEVLSMENCKISELDISHNHIGDEGLKVIFESLLTNRTLTHLNVSFTIPLSTHEENRLGKHSAEAFSNFCKSDNNLQDLRLSGN
jgi:Ran GTPase-activating protein (RanGAP) involved in mRNA processing and transport